MSGLKLIRFTLFLKFVLQYRRNIYFINNINCAFFTRNLRQSADYNSIYEFIAYFTVSSGTSKYFLMLRINPSTSCAALSALAIFSFKAEISSFNEFCSSEYFHIKFRQISSGILPFHSVLIGKPS